MKMTNKLALAILIMSSVAFAGDKGGNGGDVVVCDDLGSIELLDVYQGRESWSFIQKEFHENSRPALIHRILESYLKVDASLAKKYLRRTLEIESEITRVESGQLSKLIKLTNNQLVNIADEGVSEIPDNCKIEQAASQGVDLFPGEVKFSFQRQLWTRLNLQTQVALIFHEVIYEHLISVGEAVSRNARYLNASLLSGAHDHPASYLATSKTIQFKNLEFSSNQMVFGSAKKCVLREYFINPQGGPGYTTLLFLNKKKFGFYDSRENNLNKLVEVADRRLCD